MDSGEKKSRKRKVDEKEDEKGTKKRSRKDAKETADGSALEKKLHSKLEAFKKVLNKKKGNPPKMEDFDEILSLSENEMLPELLKIVFQDTWDTKNLEKVLFRGRVGLKYSPSDFQKFCKELGVFSSFEVILLLELALEEANWAKLDKDLKKWIGEWAFEQWKTITEFALGDIQEVISEKFGDDVIENMPKSFKDSAQENYWDEFPCGDMYYESSSVCVRNLDYSAFWSGYDRFVRKYLDLYEKEQKKFCAGLARKKETVILKSMFKIGYAASAFNGHLDYDWDHSWEYCHLASFCELIDGLFKEELKKRKEKRESKKNKKEEGGAEEEK